MIQHIRKHSGKLCRQWSKTDAASKVKSLVRPGPLCRTGEAERRENKGDRDQNDAGDVVFAAIQLLQKKVQAVIAVIIAAMLISFFVYLDYLYFTGNLW